MILHLFSTIASFAGQIQRPETVIKCISEPAAVAAGWSLKDWVPSAVSVIVAVGVFVFQGQRERRNWIRGRKADEWKEVLQAASVICTCFGKHIKEDEFISTGDQAKNDLIDIQKHTDALNACIHHSVFILSSLKVKVQFENKTNQLLKEIKDEVSSLLDLIRQIKSLPESKDQGDLLDDYDRRFRDLHKKCEGLDLNLQQRAKDDI